MRLDRLHARIHPLHLRVLIGVGPSIHPVVIRLFFHFLFVRLVTLEPIHSLLVRLVTVQPRQDPDSPANVRVHRLHARLHPLHLRVLIGVSHPYLSLCSPNESPLFVPSIESSLFFRQFNQRVVVMRPFIESALFIRLFMDNKRARGPAPGGGSRISN